MRIHPVAGLRGAVVTAIFGVRGRRDPCRLHDIVRQQNVTLGLKQGARHLKLPLGIRSMYDDDCRACSKMMHEILEWPLQQARGNSPAVVQIPESRKRWELSQRGCEFRGECVGCIEMIDSHVPVRYGRRVRLRGAGAQYDEYVTGARRQLSHRTVGLGRLAEYSDHEAIADGSGCRSRGERMPLRRGFDAGGRPRAFQTGVISRG